MLPKEVTNRELSELMATMGLMANREVQVMIEEQWPEKLMVVDMMILYSKQPIWLVVMITNMELTRLLNNTGVQVMVFPIRY